MNHFLLLFTLLTLMSCSSQKSARRPFQEQIDELEVKTAQEIKKHAMFLLENHPELSDTSKYKIKSYLDATMKKHQDLKDEESKLIQLMLQNSLSHANGQKTKDESKVLKSHLLEIYQSKSSNIFELMMQINQMAKNSEIGDGVKRDVFLFMRDFR